MFLHGFGCDRPVTLGARLNIWAVMEAVASVSLSHDEDCRCLTCRAALDEHGAMATLLADLHAREDARSALAAAPVVSPEQQEEPK